MGQGDELVVGNIPVATRLAMGSERLRLLMTNSRFIMAHLGKRGAGALLGTPIFGKLSAAVEDMFKGGGESRKKRKIEALTPTDILAADKDNFQISYGDVVRVELEDLANRVKIIILTKDDKLVFFSASDFQSVFALFRKCLGEKVAIGMTE